MQPNLVSMGPAAAQSTGRHVGRLQSSLLVVADFFTTAGAGEHELQTLRTEVCGVVLLACAGSWCVLRASITRARGDASQIRRALGRDRKGRLSPIAYAAGIALAFTEPVASAIRYAGVATIWLIPDRRVHRRIGMAPGEPRRSSNRTCKPRAGREQRGGSIRVVSGSLKGSRTRGPSGHDQSGDSGGCRHPDRCLPFVTPMTPPHSDRIAATGVLFR